MPKRVPNTEKNKKILQRMLDLNLTANELAKKSGVSERTVLRIINRQVSRPQGDTADRLAKALDSTPRKLGLRDR